MTSSFGIQPQRQLRSFYEAPERPAEPAAPAEPALTPQRRGGGTIDVRRPQEDLGLTQRVKSIQNFMEQAGKTLDVFAKEDQEKQMAKASRVYGILAQYELETAEIGEAAKKLREKGRPDLADQVISQNPWFEYGLLKTKGEHAGPRTVIETQNYINANIGELQQIEDPTDRSKKIIDYAQTYYAKHYGDIPDNIYSGVVAPVLAQAMPKMMGAVHDKHLEFRLNQANQEGRQALSDMTFEWSSFYQQSKRNPERRAQLMTQYGQAIFNSREQYTKKGFTNQQWVANVLEPWATNLYSDADENGINDIHDKNVVRALLEGLNVGVPGLGKTTLLDLVGPKSGMKIRDIINQGRLKALDADNKFEIMMDQMENRKVTDFQKGLINTAQELFSGLEGEALYDAQQKFYDQVAEARETGGTVTFMRRNEETGAMESYEVSVPYGYKLSHAEENLKKIGPPVDQKLWTYNLNRYGEMLIDDPKAEIPQDMLNLYPPGSTEYNKLMEKQRTSRERFLKDTYASEISSFEGLAKQVTKNLNKEAAAEATRGITNTKGKRQTEGRYKRALELQLPEAENIARRFARSLINDPSVSAKDLQNPTWWDTTGARRLEALIRSNSYMNDPTLFFKTVPAGKEIPLTKDPYIGVERSKTTGEVVDTQSLLTPQDFLRINEDKISRKQLQTYHTKQPMISLDTAQAVNKSLFFNQPITSEALADLRTGYGLAQKLNPGLSLGDFLAGQNGKNVFSSEGADGKPFNWKDAVKTPEFNYLKNNLASTVNNPRGTSRVKWHPGGLQHSHNPGAVDFWLEDKNGSMNVPFAAPISMKITEVNFDEGGYGNYARGYVTSDAGGLKVGDIVTIGHAKGFGKLKVGDELDEGDFWGWQHTEQSYRVGYDQAAGPGAGVHLDISITRGGQRLPQSEVRKIFLNHLSHRLSF